MPNTRRSPSAEILSICDMAAKEGESDYMVAALVAENVKDLHFKIKGASASGKCRLRPNHIVWLI